MSVCSVWTVDEVGRQEQTEQEKDPQEGEARPPDLEQDAWPGKLLGYKAINILYFIDPYH